MLQCKFTLTANGSALGIHRGEFVKNDGRERFSVRYSLLLRNEYSEQVFHTNL